MSPTRAALALLLVLTPLTARQDPLPRLPPAELAKLTWISGTWECKQGELTTEEHWRPLYGTSLMGLSHSYDAERTRSFEFLRITCIEDQIVYLASPGGSPPVAFPAVRLDEQEAVFENPEHDHPQRIRYQRSAKGLTATVSMLDGTRAQSFEYTRSAR